jgi:hypothetical protein
MDAPSRMIVCWRAVSNVSTVTVPDANEVAGQHEEPRRHSDAVSQVTSIRYGERLRQG